MRKIATLFVSAFVLLLCLSKISFAAGGSDPVQMLKSISDQMISELQSHKATLKTNPSVVYSFAYRIIVPHADMNEMSKRVLPPRIWNEATPAQRAQFQKEFTSLLVHTYASALAEYKDETVNFSPIRGGSQGQSTVKVDSTIVRSEGPSIAVSYRLIQTGSQWKLYDLIVEGVSMLESFRSQFADKLAQGSMADLINDLANHNNNS